MSDAMGLSEENNLERYLPFIVGLLYMEGSQDVPIKIDTESKGKKVRN